MTQPSIFEHASEGNDLRSFLSLIERAKGEGIARVSREVSREHELSAVVKRLEGQDDRVVWFDRVAGTSMPVVMNLFGTKQRIAYALGLDNAAPNQVIDEFLSRLDRDVSPKIVADGPVKGVRAPAVDLGSLPISVHAPEDGGPYITSGVLLVRDPLTRAINAGIYRVMVQNERQATVSVDPGHDLGKVIAWGGREERPVEFAIVIGAHPALSIASQAKVPMTRDTYHVMGALLGEPVDVVACDTVDLHVPANAEIVLEGRILPGETAAEGPFGEFHYYYGSDPRAALCDITAISHRSDAIFADIHPTHRDHRCLWLHPGREASLLQRLRAAIPSVEAVHLPLEGAGMVALISIDKRHNGDSTRALLIALSFDLFIKHAVILDRDIDIYDAGQVVWAMAVRLRPDRDLVVIPRVRGYHEDPSSYSLGSSDEGGRLTTKLGYDATVPIGGHFPERADSLPSRYAGLDPLEYVDNPVPDALD